MRQTLEMKVLMRLWNEVQSGNVIRLDLMTFD